MNAVWVVKCWCKEGEQVYTMLFDNANNVLDSIAFSWSKTDIKPVVTQTANFITATVLGESRPRVVAQYTSIYNGVTHL